MSVMSNTRIFTWVNQIKYGILLICADLQEVHKRDLAIDLEGFLVKYPETVVGIYLIKAREREGRDEKKNKNCKCSETRELGRVGPYPVQLPGPRTCTQTPILPVLTLFPLPSIHHQNLLLSIFSFIPTAKY